MSNRFERGDGWNPKKILVGFSPVEKRTEYPKVEGVADIPTTVEVIGGYTGPERVPFYNSAGEIIGYNDYITDISGDEIETTLHVLPDGTSFWG